jgi:DNA-binding IclR family transcriptional regulator
MIATPTTAQRNYCFPQEQPVTKEELTQHIKNAERSGYSLTFEEHTRDIEQWLKEL